MKRTRQWIKNENIHMNHVKIMIVPHSYATQLCRTIVPHSHAAHPGESHGEINSSPNFRRCTHRVQLAALGGNPPRHLTFELLHILHDTRPLDLLPFVGVRSGLQCSILDQGPRVVPQVRVQVVHVAGPALLGGTLAVEYPFRYLCASRREHVRTQTDTDVTHACPGGAVAPRPGSTTFGGVHMPGKRRIDRH